MDPRKLFCDEASCEILIFAGSGKQARKFVAHTIVLITVSNVFRKQLKDGRRLEFMEFKATTIAQLMRYIYLGKITMRNCLRAVELLEISNRYHMLDLMNRCHLYLQKNLDYGSILPVFEYTWAIGQKDLEFKCLDFIGFYAMPLFYSEQFVCLTALNSLIAIAAQGKLNIRHESDLFWAVWRWGREVTATRTWPCTEEDVLSLVRPVLPHIRFNYMKASEMHDLPHCIQRIAGTFKSYQLSRQNNFPNPDKRSMTRFGVAVLIKGWYDYSNKLNKLTQENRLIIFSSDKPGYVLGFKLRICGENFDNMDLRLQFRSVKTEEVYVDEIIPADIERENVFDHPYVPVKMIVALKNLPYINADEPYELRSLPRYNDKIWFPPMKNLPQQMDLSHSDFTITFFKDSLGVDELYFTEVDDSRLIFAVK